MTSGSRFALAHLSERWMALIVIGFGLALYLPFAGSYGLWDPWETHYGEVARQMTKRGDFISLWWPGSARETQTFQTKPVLSFWLMSLGMHVFRVGLPSGNPGEMAVGTAAEWAVRTPFCVLGALGMWAVYLVTSRFASRRAGLLAALVAGTCPLYLLVARQAMTDMAFVGPMALALAMLMFGIFHEEDPAPELPRRGGRRLGWPHHPLFYATLGLFVLATIPQLVIDSIQLRVVVDWGGRPQTMYGAVAMAPYYLGVLVVIGLLTRVRHRSPLYLTVAGTLAGLGILGKGLAGFALPAVIFFVFLLFSGGWRRFTRTQRLLGVGIALLACAVVAVPWHHAMIVRHGWQWWSELFGDNHWRRLLMGRHGDRGTFEYFLRELGYGILPWVALAPAALLAAVSAGPAMPERRRRLLALGASWFVCAYSVVSFSMTKFHHYVLPAVPGLAIVIGCFLDDLLDRRDRWPLAAAIAGVPLLGIVAFDLVSEQNAAQRFLWLFSYDYVHSPRGRAWPEVLDFRAAIITFTALFALSTVALGIARARRWALATLGLAAVGFTFFLLDVFMPKVAPFWSQKDAVAHYFNARRAPDERLVAYKMFWRGETFYTKNAIFEGPDDERTVFDSDGNEADTKLRDWAAPRKGQRHYFLFERSRESHLRSLLPPGGSFEVLPGKSNKFALARADL